MTYIGFKCPLEVLQETYEVKCKNMKLSLNFGEDMHLEMLMMFLKIFTLIKIFLKTNYKGFVIIKKGENVRSQVLMITIIQLCARHVFRRLRKVSKLPNAYLKFSDICCEIALECSSKDFALEHRSLLCSSRCE